MKNIKYFLFLIALFFIFSINCFAAKEDLNIFFNDTEINLKIENDSYTFDYHINKDVIGEWKDSSNNVLRVNSYGNGSINMTFLDNKIESNLINNKGTFTVNGKSGSISIDRKNKTDLIIYSDKAYGIVGKFDYKDTDLKFIKCVTNQFYEFSQNGNNFIFESAKLSSNSLIGICSFEVLNDNYKLSINGLDYSNSETVYNIGKLSIDNKNNIKYNENSSDVVSSVVQNGDNNKVDNTAVDLNDDKKDSEQKDDKVVENPYTGIKIISFSIIGIALIIIVCNKKSRKIFFKLSIFIVVISPLLVKADGVEDRLQTVRSHLLNIDTIKDVVVYDFDKDNLITINDLIIIKLNDSVPRFNFEDSYEKGSEYYSKFEKKVSVVSSGKITSLKYCLTTEEKCTPNTYFNDVIVYNSNVSAQRICVYAENEFGLSNEYCDKESYKVDTTVPVLTVKSNLVTVSDDKNYDYKTNITSSFGISGGNVSCSKLNQTYTCSAVGNNGLTTTKSFKIDTTKNKRAVFFGDSIDASPYSWANYSGAENHFADRVNYGVPGYSIIKPNTNPGVGSLLDIVEAHKTEKADYIIFQGGFNDFTLNPSIGKFDANDFSGKYDTTTWIGAIETYIYKIKTYWPKAKYGFIITYQTPLAINADVNAPSVDKQREYWNAAKPVFDKWGISYIDLFDGSTPDGVKYSDLLKVDTETYIRDKIHLNSNGFKLINPHIYNWILEID